MLRARRSRIGDGGDAVAHVQIFLRHDAVRDQPRDRIIRAAHFGHFERFRIVVEAAGIGDLSARFGIDRGAVEDDFGFRALLDFVYRAVFGDDGFDAAVARCGAEVKVGLGFVCFRELRVGGIRGFFVRAFPGGFGARALLFHRALEASPVDLTPASRSHVFDEIARQSVGVVELERFLARISTYSLALQLGS